jgi:hypothetical protein
MKRFFLPLIVLFLGAALAAQENVWNTVDSPLKNPSFEAVAADRPGEPESWNVFTESGEVGLSRLYSETAQHGHQSMFLAFDTKRDKYFGIAQEVELAPGQKWKLTAFVRNLGLKGTSHLRLGMEWKDAENKELLRSQGTKIERSNTSDREWTKFEVTGTAPPGTTHATLTVTVYVADSEEGSVLIDTVWLEPVQEPLKK